MRKEHTTDLQCSFCGKHQHAVSKMIAGPTVYICNECIGLCNDIIAEEVDRQTESQGEVRAVLVARLKRHEATLSSLVASVRRHGDLFPASVKGAVDELDLASTRLRQVISESMTLDDPGKPSA